MAKSKGEIHNDDSETSVATDDLSHLLVCADSLGNRRQQWIWQGRILEGKINLVQGWKGAGKSTTVASIAVHYLMGLKLPGNAKGGKKGGVCLWLTTEEDIEIDVKPRWIAQGGSLKQLFCFDPNKEKHMFPSLPGDVYTLAAMCKANNVRILVLDPYSSLGDGKNDFNNEPSARAYMESLKILCESAKLTVILIGHLRKGRSGSAIEAGIGSVAIPNVSRSVLRADKHPKKPDTFLLSAIAVNASSPTLPISYTLQGKKGEAPKVHWGKTEEIPLDEIIAGQADAGEEDEALDAKTLIIRELTEGPKPAEDMLKAAQSAGIGIRTLRKAKAILAVKSKRISKGGKGAGHFVWVLPPQTKPTPAK